MTGSRMTGPPMSEPATGTGAGGEVSLDLAVDCEDWARDVANPTPMALAALKAARDASDGPGGEVCVRLTDDRGMQALNRQWRSRDAPTDVLAFPAGVNAAAFLGDIAVGHGVCAKDAADLGRPLGEHLAHMLIHAYLHLIGYDHQDDEDARTMQALEIAAMDSLGYRTPYPDTLDHASSR